MLLLDADARGPQDPQPAPPDRRPWSVRRTSTIDTRWPDGFGGDFRITARGRDLLTTGEDARTLVDVAIRLHVSAADRTIVGLEAEGAHDADALAPLVGVGTGSGYRAAVAQALPWLADSPSPLRLLLDDLPGAALVSGYALLAGGALSAPTDPEALESRADICAGWVAGGTFMSAVREHGEIPTPVGPPSLDWDRPDDPLAWHPIEPVAASSTRRRRLLDVHLDDRGDVRVEATFRDSHADEDRLERSFHEYAVEATLTLPELQVTAIAATPRVLPWLECPAAVRSADRLVGLSLDEVRTAVHDQRGVKTCTHLDDTLKNLDGVAHLADHLTKEPGTAQR